MRIAKAFYKTHCLSVCCFLLLFHTFLRAALLKMSKELSHAADLRDYSLHDLPVNQNDEIGQIARAFDVLADELNKQRTG